MGAARYATGKIEAKVARPSGRVRPRAGVRSLGLTDERDPLLLGPTGESGRPVPLIVSLHGAGGDARGGLALFADAVAERDIVLLAPPSRGRTWDAIAGGRFGPDVELLDRALELIFDSFEIDRERVALAGFSDGASYALSLGLKNGDLFTRLVALSPGFVGDHPRAGTPPIFIAHGTEDPVLPIDRTSRTIVPQLRAEGYHVRYEEFPGGHEVPRWLATEAVVWLCEGLPSEGST
jgi:predicted esterase